VALPELVVTASGVAATALPARYSFGAGTAVLDRRPAAMAAGSLSVVGNASRLRRFRPSAVPPADVPLRAAAGITETRRI
jgi:hypothetical protein